MKNLLAIAVLILSTALSAQVQLGKNVQIGSPGPVGPPGTGGIGCGTGNCVVTIPASGSQNISGNLTVANLMPTPAAIGSIVNLVWDDDCDTDPGCFMTQAALMHWVDAKQVNLLAVTADSTNPAAAPALKIILNYYGYSSIPVGAYQGGADTGTAYAGQVVAQFNPGDKRSNYPSCVATMRTALAAAANSSVVLVGTGYAFCIRALQVSPADGISALTGAQLIQAKVSKYVQMGGEYPTSLPTCCGGVTPGAEFNFADKDPADFAAIYTTWTTANGFPPIYFVGYTAGINGGNAGIPSSFPLTNPAQYGVSVSPFKTRPSWDTLALWYAIFGNVNGAFTISASGTNTVNPSNGSNTWASSPAAGQFYLTDAQPFTFYQAYLDGQNATGADWFMPYNQAGLLLYPQLQCSFAYGCLYGGAQGPIQIGPYTEAYGPTGNIAISKPTGSNVLDFQQNGISKLNIGVDDGTGNFMLGTNSGDSGLRITSGQKFYITNAFGTPSIGFDLGVHTYATGPAGSSMNMDNQSGGRIVATGLNTTTPNTMLIESLSSNFSVTNVLANMNAAGFIQLGSAANKGVDQAGNSAFTSLTLGTGVQVTNTSVLPQVGTLTVGRASCIKATGPPVVIGFCSTVVDASGACTCN